ncbi:DMT family transporter [Mucilaginibacter sp. L3T2-6]|uniref:DMT family transporter n=1 Tax=Mucilaginibacter sp. L3T2-6 TaxID=3062491 RepID=UPI0026745F1B|nr:DMT family transporter [Mucilaginibacter sp. L3T2-6]MDO3642396.1 DMT family transporter [Mucilaginibacter sp. L3T2-6]MDV6214891.1 DMT family transporter [Mucilaginibacter sp. L3T2-6]
MNVQYYYALMPLVVGTCLPVMAASNGALGKTLGSPFWAVFFAFSIAAVIAGLIILFGVRQAPSAGQFAATGPQMWLGGLVIAANIITFTIAPQKIGIGVTIILFIAGQMLSSVLIEHWGWLSYAKHPVNWPRLAGLVLLLTGVALIKIY